MDKKKQTEFDFNVANATRRSKSIKTKKTTRQKSRELTDKFYTRPECVKHLVETVLRFFPHTKFFVEPSAGSGNFNHYLASFHTDLVYQSEFRLLSDLKAPRGWFPDRSVRSAVLIPKAAIPEQCRL